MNEVTSKNDVLEFAGEGKPKLPGSLNVLTILTIIWSCISIVSAIWTFISSKKTYDTMKENIESGKMDNVPGWMKGMMGPDALVMYQKMYENRLPLLILGVVASILCLYGAMEMRKLKKQGYTFWLIGELLPIAAGIIFIGMAPFTGFGLIGVLFPVIFIILYTVNRKELIY